MAEVLHSNDVGNTFLARLESELKSRFKGCKRVAVKLHFGESGNKTALTPADARPITDILTRLGSNFYLFDSSVIYGGPRGEPETHKKLAIERGWGEIGEIRTGQSSERVKKEHLDYNVCAELTNADAVLVISHFKGHVCSGFGGAIKNLGMGALTKESKLTVHDGGKYKYVGGCTQCKACEKICPLGFITVKEKPEFRDCWGCSLCAEVCPAGAIETKVAPFDVLLAEGAAAAAQSFKNSYYVTIAKRITKLCDCASNSKEIISKDCGIFASADPVAIDKAAHDAVIRSEGKDVFLEHNSKSGLAQVKAAEGFGMGSSAYELIEV